MRILIVEDDPDLRGLLAQGLGAEGYAVVLAHNGAEAVRAVNADLAAVVLDIGLPDADGRDVLQAMRARGLTAPVIFLTARDTVTDKLSGFSAGGDDYLTKPFVFAELAARVEALLRRAGTDGSLSVGSLRLDPREHAIVADGGRVDLTPTEYRVLAALAATPERAVRRRELVRAAWPDGAIVHDNSLDQYIARLRRKLRDLPDGPQIETVHGVGYRLI